ncbi:hypothetical protein ACRYCC_32720 [Actinomadura scrupuli]|uniref:hypothetical protein n=1 Tax=Actinomadura scrupuli TaxID=559629 RepID=UPI003D9621A2
MDEELIAECHRLLRDGFPDELPERRVLRDEHDFIPLGLDVDGDIAVVAMLRWWKGPPERPSRLPQPRPLIDVRPFLRLGGNWSSLGGGGGLVPEYPLTDRPAAAHLGGHLRHHGAGSTYAGDTSLDTDLYISHARIRAAAEIDRVQVGARLLPVPFHGHVVVVWPGRHAPTIDALAADGTRLVSLTIDSDRESGGRFQ